MKFAESAVANAVQSNLLQEKIAWSASFTEIFIKAAVEGITTYLGQVKNEGPKTVVVKNGDNTVVFSASIEKHESDDGEGFSVNMLVNPTEDELVGDKVTFDDVVLSAIFEKVASKYRFNIAPINGQEYTSKLIAVMIKSIKEYFRTNIDVDPVLEIPNFVIFEGYVEDDKVKVKVVLDAAIKQIVKDDAVLEEEAK
jgi:hypothetical protein|nr:MAG TPA: hypothetical protein [Caudoviricetes sp.]